MNMLFINVTYAVNNLYEKVIMK